MDPRCIYEEINFGKNKCVRIKKVISNGKYKRVKTMQGEEKHMFRPQIIKSLIKDGGVTNKTCTLFCFIYVVLPFTYKNMLTFLIGNK